MSDISAIASIVTEQFGSDAKIASVQPVYGGDINEARLVVLEDGRKIFLKLNRRDKAGFFEAESKGLEAIRKTGAIQVPELLGVGVRDKKAYLMMEYLEAGSKKAGYWEHFGKQLAAMHRADTSEWTPGGLYGFPEDNYIGAGEQMNQIRGSWVDFFRECRLEVQFRRASHYFDSSDRKDFQKLLNHLEDYIPEPEYPSLLHGDLWGGNFVTGSDGYAWLIDPAVYVGHLEADLAMTELFGGFSRTFYESYQEINPLLPGYKDRRDLYNLYHLLNHLNLFGGGYYGSVMRIVRRFK